ncbi:MAG: lamin tail domain-containing protein [Methanomassiliicoccus sp.]|nr:lamin tail domain-containing protein [Methanomassiliicoccus sp.]
MAAIAPIAILLIGAALAGNGHIKSTVNGSGDKASGNDGGNTNVVNTTTTTNAAGTSDARPKNDGTGIKNLHDQTVSEVVVRIIEVESNPAGTDAGNEWVVIKNEGNDSVDLTRWTIRSSSGETNIYVLSGTIEPDQSLKIVFTKQFLNNGDEVAKLIDPDGTVIDATPAIDDMSNDSWTWVRPGA